MKRISLAIVGFVSTCIASIAAGAIPSDEEIRALLAARMQHNGVGIVVGIIEPAGRRVVPFGKRGANDARPLDGDTIFQIGSLTKPFTTLLLSDMAQRGEVKLEDPAALYLPRAVRMPQRGRPITLLDLAMHKSGLPSMPTNYVLTARPDPYEAYSVEQLHDFLSNYELPRAPGEKFEYSNLGVALLGRLLADRARINYESLLRERVFKPLDMQSTAIQLTSDQKRRLAPGHDRDLRAVHSWEMMSLPASGSLRSTANDMLRLLGAYLGYESTPLKAAMERQLAGSLDANMPALSWGVKRVGDMQVFNHSGGKQGYRSGAAFDLRSRTGVVVLANARTDDAPIDIAMHLLSGMSLQQAPQAASRNIVALDRNRLESYAGEYRLEGEPLISIAPKAGHLLVHVPGDGVIEFHPSGERDFFLNTGNDEMTFELDANGRVTGFLLYGNGREAGQSRRATKVDRASR